MENILEPAPASPGIVDREPAVERDFLARMAVKYIWWESPDAALRFPRRVIAQVMELGTFDDSQELLRTSGPGALAEVIAHAQAGWFTPRSWHYWHYRLRLADPGEVPPLPVRSFT